MRLAKHRPPDQGLGFNVKPEALSDEARGGGSGGADGGIDSEGRRRPRAERRI